MWPGGREAGRWRNNFLSDNILLTSARTDALAQTLTRAPRIGFFSAVVVERKTFDQD